MDTPTLLHIIWSVFGAVGLAILSFIGWGIKKLVTTTFENTVAIKILDGHIERLVKGYARIDKLENDMNNAHIKIREIKGVS